MDLSLQRVGEVVGPPVLLVPGLAATPLPFALHPRRSLATSLEQTGRTPWLARFHVHWRRSDQGAGALLHALEVALAELRRHSGVDLDRVDAIGHSLGGILLLALAADGVPLRRLVTLATALDYRLGRAPLPRLLSLAPRGLDPIRLRLRHGGVPVTGLARLGAPLFGRGLDLPLQRDQFHPGATQGAVVRRIMRDGVADMPLPLLLDLADLFTEGGLHLGRADRPLKELVSTLALPVLLVAARQDRQCPLTAVRAAAASIPGARLLEVGEEAAGYGHVDLMTGDRAPEEVFDPLVRFLDSPHPTERA